MSVIMELQAIRRSNVLSYLQHNAAVMSVGPMRSQLCLQNTNERQGIVCCRLQSQYTRKLILKYLRVNTSDNFQF